MSVSNAPNCNKLRNIYIAFKIRVQQFMIYTGIITIEMF